MAKITEGSPEWFEVRRRITADYIRASDAIGVAASSIRRILHDWQTMDDELKSALFHSAVIHFARPFSYKRDYGGDGLKHRAGFDQELHGHLIDLRHSLVAHHDNDVLRAWVGHQNFDLAHNGIQYTVMVSTCAAVKALHTIQEKSVAERYLSHIMACEAFFQEAARRELSAIHEMALRFPAAVDAGTGEVQPIPIEQQVTTTQVPSMVNFGPSGIPEPQFPLPRFPLPQGSYQYRTAAMTFFRTGKIEIETPSGTALIEISDRPTADAAPSTDDADPSPS
jgi:hypothetical protein